MLDGINFLDLFELSYILAVFLVTQVIKNYIGISHKWDKRTVTLLVALFTAAVFIAGHHFLGRIEDNESYAKRLFLSFLLTIGFYDYIYKLLADFFKKRQISKEFNDKLQDNG